MRRIPAWARKPALFIMGLICLEPLRWSVGSIFDETYATFGWRWAKLAAAMSESLALVSYILITAGILAVMIWIGRELLRPDPPVDLAIIQSKPPERSLAPTSSNQAPAKSGPTLSGTSNAYRKAVLQVTEVKSEREAAAGGQIKSALCWMQVSNVILQPLQKCSVELLSLEREGKVQEINKTMRAGTFSLANGHGRRLALARRDRTDLVSNPPHLIRTVDGDFGFEDGSKYLVRLALHSEYAHPTLVTIELDVPEDPDGAVTGKVVSQDVDRA